METTLYKVNRSDDTISVTGGADNVLYLEGHENQSQISLARPATPNSPQQPIGSVNVDRSGAQINMANGALTMQKAGMFSHSFEVRGPGITWTWESAMSNKYTLVDKSTGSQVARYEKSGRFSSSWTLQTFGSLPPQTFEAVILSALAAGEMREQKKKRARKIAIIA